jgi:hypothetical protein
VSVFVLVVKANEWLGPDFFASAKNEKTWGGILPLAALPLAARPLATRPLAILPSAVL